MLVMTREPVASRIEAVVVAACTRTIRGIQSEVRLGVADGMPEECVVSFDNLHTVRRALLRRRITRLSPDRMNEVCRALRLAMACG